MPPSLKDAEAGIAFGNQGEVRIGEGFREITSAWMAGAASQARKVHEEVSYDVEVDTTSTESLECARIIAEHVS